MKTLIGIAIVPLICIGVMILTAAVVIFALRRGTRAINKQVQENAVSGDKSASANTRWARGDLESTPKPGKIKQPMKTCPACGGENTSDSTVCAFCGRVL